MGEAIKTKSSGGYVSIDGRSDVYGRNDWSRCGGLAAAARETPYAVTDTVLLCSTYCTRTAPLRGQVVLHVNHVATPQGVQDAKVPVARARDRDCMQTTTLCLGGQKHSNAILRQLRRRVYTEVLEDPDKKPNHTSETARNNVHAILLIVDCTDRSSLDMEQSNRSLAGMTVSQAYTKQTWNVTSSVTNEEDSRRAVCCHPSLHRA